MPPNRDPSQVDAELVALVRELCDRAGSEADETLARAALAPLSSYEEASLRRFAKGSAPARPLGAMAWADIARGTSPSVAAARELSGYYALLAERDTLARLVGAPLKAVPQSARPREPAPPPALPEAPARRPRAVKVDGTRAQQILGLYSYHRDAPRVARELGLSLSELEQELDALKLRRKTARLVRGLDSDLPASQPSSPLRSGPPIRRRPAPPKAAAAEKLAPPPPPPPPPAVAALARPIAPSRVTPSEGVLRQSAQLKKLLAEVGPRRAKLAETLGSASQPLPDRVLLARFRSAGLEREFGQRERDLLRGLYAVYRGSSAEVAKDLGIKPEELAALVKERALQREVDELRQASRADARKAPWPRARIELFLGKREWLQDLGVYQELHDEVSARATLAWEKLLASGKKPREAVEALAHELRLKPAEARALLRVLGLKGKAEG